MAEFTSPPAQMPAAGLLASRSAVLRLAIIALAYFVAHQIAFLFPDAGKVLVAVWPAGGIGLAALLLNPRRLWPAILVTLFVAGNTANLLDGRPLAASLGFMTANVLESLACAALILWWRGPKAAGQRLTFARVREIGALLGAALGVNPLTAILGAGTATLTTGAPFWGFWSTWCVADGLGILLVTPLIIIWSTFPLRSLRRPSRQALEGGLFIAIWSAVAWLSFQPVGLQFIFTPRPYLLVALLAWPAIRLGPRGITLALALVAVIAVISPAVGVGPLLWGGNSPLQRLLNVQIFLAAITLMGLLLAANHAETQAAQRASHEDQARLRALGDNLPNGAVYQVMREPEGGLRFIYVSAGIQPLTGLSVERVLQDPHSILNLVVEEDRPKLRAARAAVDQDLSLASAVVRLRRLDGAVRWMEFTAASRRLAGGQTVWDSIVLDVTERQQAEDEVRGLNARLEERVAARTAELTQANQRLEAEIAERQRIEQALQAQAELLTLTGQTAHVGGWEFDPQTMTGKGTDETARIYDLDPGVRADFSQGLSAFTEPHRQALENATREAVTLGKPYELELELVTAKGNRKWVRLVGRAVMAGGQVVKVYGSLQDITERVRAEAEIRQLNAHLEQRVAERTGQLEAAVRELRGEMAARRRVEGALRVSEERYRGLFENAVEGVFQSTPEGRFLRVNAAMARLYGYASPEEMIALVGDDITHRCYVDPERRADFRRLMAAEGAVKEFEALEYRKDGGLIWTRSSARVVREASGALLCYEGFLEDITERKHLEEALQASEKKYRQLYESLRDAYVAVEMNGRITEFNGAFTQMLGYPPETILQLTYHDLTPEKWHAFEADIVTQQILVRGYSDLYAKEYRRSDGTVFPVELQTYLLRDDAGQASGMWAIVRDITERRQAEAALREAQQRYQGIYENAIEGIFQSTPEGRYLRVNPAMARIFGYASPEAMITAVGDDIEHRIHVEPANRAEFTRRLQRDGMIHDFEAPNYRQDGSIIWTRTSARAVRAPAGAVLYYEGFLEDITEWKTAERAKAEIEFYYRQVVDNSGVGIVALDEAGRYRLVNTTAAERMRGKPEDFIGRTMDAVLPKHVADYYTVANRQLLATGGSQEYDVTFELINGTRTFHNLDRVISDLEGRPIAIVGSSIDITPRKQMEEALRAVSERLELTQQAAEVGAWDWDVPTNHIVWSPQMYALFGLDPQAPASFDAWRAVLHPDDRAAAEQRITDALQAHRHLVNLYRIIWPGDGQVRWINAIGRGFYDAQGAPLRMSGICLDITAQKQAEEAQRQSEARLRTYIERAPEGIWVADAAGRYSDVNPAGCALLGYTRDELLQRTLYDLMPAAEAAAVRAQFDGLPAGATLSGELRLRRQDGTALTVFHNTVRLPGGDCVSFCADITARKLAEHERAASLELLRRMNASFDTRSLLKTTLIFFKDWSGCEAVGIRLREGDDFPYFEVQGFPKHFLQTENRLCAVDVDGETIRDATGNPVLECMCGNILCGRVDPVQPFFTAHGSFWSNGTTELLASTTDADRQTHTRNRCNGEGYESVALIPLRSGGETLGLVQLNDRRPGQFTPELIEQLERLADQVANTLAKQQAAEALRASETRYRQTAEENARLLALSQKDAVTQATLLHEVNHRVKNNLAAIIGLLYLEQRYRSAGGQAPYEALVRDLTGRIQSLALVHDLLSAGVWAPLPLTHLAERVLQVALAMAPAHSRVLVEVEPSAVQLSPKQANALGLIFNELATNALKYAARETGPLRLSLGVDQAAGEVRLEFCDNGPGFPAAVLGGGRQSIGLHLIRNLTEHDLGGTVTLGNAGGAVVRLRFPAAPAPPPPPAPRERDDA